MTEEEVFRRGDRFRVIASMTKLVGMEGELTGVQWTETFTFVTIHCKDGCDYQFARECLERL